MLGYTPEQMMGIASMLGSFGSAMAQPNWQGALGDAVSQQAQGAMMAKAQQEQMDLIRQALGIPKEQTGFIPAIPKATVDMATAGTSSGTATKPVKKESALKEPPAVPSMINGQNILDLAFYQR